MLWENWIWKIEINSANVSNRSGSKIETKSQLMQLQATLAEKSAAAAAAAVKGENDDDDW